MLNCWSYLVNIWLLQFCFSS